MKRFTNLLSALAVWVGTMMPTAAWAADVWDGQTCTQPTFHTQKGGYSNVFTIGKASDLAFVREHFKEKAEIADHPEIELYYNAANYLLLDDLDMGTASWIPIGFGDHSDTALYGTFDGDGHSIRISISGATSNGQGLFAWIGPEGSVQSLILDGKIECADSRQVGGIAGSCSGVIRNCVVRADVSSGWREAASFEDAIVGGITGYLFDNGEVRYCCMTGNVTNHDNGVGGIVGKATVSGKIRDCVFYGIRTSDHSQYNLYVGTEPGLMENMHGDDLLDDEALENYLTSLGNTTQSANYCFTNAVREPYSITMKGHGATSLTVNRTKARPEKTITLTLAAGNRIALIDVTAADGTRVARWTNPQEASYTFAMPRRDVTVTALDMPAQGSGTATDPYLIASTDDWNNLHALVMAAETGKALSGICFRQTADLDVTRGIGVTGEGHDIAFAGTYDGGGYKLRCNITNPVSGSTHPVAPFYMVRDATLKNIHVTGTISGGIHTAGLVAWTSGTVEIDSCRVSADVACTSNQLNPAHGGGIVGHAYDSQLTVRNSMFDGTLRAAAGDGSGARLGAIIGWGGTETSVFNCLECATFTTTGQTAFCWKDSGLGVADIDFASGNKHVTAFSATIDNTYRLYPVTSGTEGLALDFSDGNWKQTEYPGGDVLRNDVQNQNHFEIGGTVYAMEGNTVQFTVSYPKHWETVKIFIGDTELEASAYGYYTFTQGASNSVVTAEYEQMTVVPLRDDDPGVIPILQEANGETVVAKLEGRTLYRDGSWNTLCLPFALTSLEGTPLEGATVKTLSSSLLVGGTLTLNFSDDLTAIDAGKPYIVKWATAQDTDIEDPMFLAVTINLVNRDVVTDELAFRGLYKPFAIGGEDRSLLYLDADNKLCYPNAAMQIDAFRAYFELADGITAGDPASGIRSFVLNFEGEETGIREINASNPSNPSNFSNPSTPWFTLDGSCLNGQPVHGGLYLHNGRKVMIK